jgi:hypothetical protein
MTNLLLPEEGFHLITIEVDIDDIYAECNEFTRKSATNIEVAILASLSSI